MDGIVANLKVINDPQYQAIDRQIIGIEKELLSNAPEAIKKMYHQIDFLVCKQHEREKDILKIY
jgi:hypothetical protein